MKNNCLLEKDLLVMYILSVCILYFDILSGQFNPMKTIHFYYFLIYNLIIVQSSIVLWR